MGRTTQNLGVDLHEFQSFGAAIKLAGGDADAAKGQFASMAQALFALTTRGDCPAAAFPIVQESGPSRFQR